MRVFVKSLACSASIKFKFLTKNLAERNKFHQKKSNQIKKIQKNESHNFFLLQKKCLFNYYWISNNESSDNVAYFTVNEIQNIYEFA
jgi:hypothetical protein